MSKWIKRAAVLGAVGAAAAGLVCYLKKSSAEMTDSDMDDFEDEDFDLDNDLKPVTDREYVPLNTPPRTETPSEPSGEDSPAPEEDDRNDEAEQPADAE